MVGKRLVKLTDLMDWLNTILPDAPVRRSFLYRLRRDFARELQKSLRVKRGKPLCEDEIARLWRSKR